MLLLLFFISFVDIHQMFIIDLSLFFFFLRYLFFIVLNFQDPFIDFTLIVGAQLRFIALLLAKQLLLFFHIVDNKFNVLSLIWIIKDGHYASWDTAIDLELERGSWWYLSRSLWKVMYFWYSWKLFQWVWMVIWPKTNPLIFSSIKLLFLPQTIFKQVIEP